MKVCKNCKAENPDKAKHCVECDAELDDKQAEEETPAMKMLKETHAAVTDLQNRFKAVDKRREEKKGDGKKEERPKRTSSILDIF